MGKRNRDKAARKQATQIPPPQRSTSWREVFEYIGLILWLGYSAMTAFGISVNFPAGCLLLAVFLFAMFDLLWRIVRLPTWGKVIVSIIGVGFGGGILVLGYRNTHRQNLETPFVRIEPETDVQVSDTGQFVLRLVNYGIDIDHPKIDMDYFVAQKGNDIRIKRILNVGGVTDPIVLRANQWLPIHVAFGPRPNLKPNDLSVESAYRLAVQTNPVPSILGVRITATFRRFSDEKEFNIVRAFSADRGPGPSGSLMSLFGPQGDHLKPAPGVTENRLTLDEVMPYIQSSERWSSLSVTFKDGKWSSAQ